MSSARIEFYFDFTCPYAYLASTRIEAISRAHDATLLWRPMLLGGVFRAIGDGASPMERMVAAKARHNADDMHRWAEHLGVPLVMPAAHPMRSVRALRVLLGLPEEVWPPVIHEMYRAYWQRGDDITLARTLAEVLTRAGVSEERSQRALASNDEAAIKSELRRRTDEAVERGVFGAPAMFVHVPDQATPYLFWGQDRLHMVEAVLTGWRPGRNAPTIESRGRPEGAADRMGPRPRVHFFYDFSSPFAYLGVTQIERLVERAGAALVWRPILLGALFREVGTPDVPIQLMSESKRRYIRQDLDHWASYWQVPFRFATRFPQRTITALRLALLAGDRIAELSHALFRVPWVDNGDLDDGDTLVRVLDEQGFPAKEMLARTREPEVKKLLIDNTAEAVARGVFGAPTCIVEPAANRARMANQTGDGSVAPGPQLFWGQDRFPLVSAALNGWRPAGG